MSKMKTKTVMIPQGFYGKDLTHDEILAWENYSGSDNSADRPYAVEILNTELCQYGMNYLCRLNTNQLVAARIDYADWENARQMHSDKLESELNAWEAQSQE